MKTKATATIGKLPCVIRLHAADRYRIHAHLLALDATDRALRFGAATDADAIDRYVGSIAFDRGAVLGVEAPDGALIGLGHLAPGDDFAELGLSVSDGHRQRGVASALTAAALRAAESLGAAEFRLHFAATNAGMRRLARQLGMQISTEGSELTAHRALRAPAAPAATRRPSVACCSPNA